MITNSIACYHYYKDPAEVMKYVKDEFQGKKKGALGDAENQEEDDADGDYRTHQSYKNKSTFQKIENYLLCTVLLRTIASLKDLNEWMKEQQRKLL